jgi:hypothetical protein
MEWSSMQEGSSQQPKPIRQVAYRSLAPAGINKGMSAAAYGCVAAATGLGLVLGVTAAVAAGHRAAPTAPQLNAAFNAQPSTLASLSASIVAPSPTLLRTVDTQRKPASNPTLLARVSEHAVSRHGRKKHRLHKLLDWKKDSRARKGARRMPYISPTPAAPVDQPTALQLATAAAAAGPFFLGIQGDATVASYDATTGTIQTYEGETYLIAKNEADKNPIVWQDYPFDVHYRCDEVGNCTLSHAGASVTAKLTR